MRNTAQDLQDCIWAIEQGEYTDDEISYEEKRALERIVEMAHTIVNELEYEIEEIISNENV
jgi:hypothetical protein